MGTKSTRHEIVGKLYERGYVQHDPAKPTEKAIALIEALEKYATLITKPEMTKTLEQEMEEIKAGQRSKENVADDSRKMLRAVFTEMVMNREAIANSLKQAMRTGTIVGSCPECGSDLFLATSARGKRFVGCLNYPTCTFSLPLPRSGRIVVTEQSCEQHPFLYKLKILTKGKKRPWDFGCPYCNLLQWQEKKSAPEQTAQSPGQPSEGLI
jgi:DNA topoisomerase-1